MNLELISKGKSYIMRTIMFRKTNVFRRKTVLIGGRDVHIRGYSGS